MESLYNCVDHIFIWESIQSVYDFEGEFIDKSNHFSLFNVVNNPVLTNGYKRFSILSLLKMCLESAYYELHFWRLLITDSKNVCGFITIY